MFGNVSKFQKRIQELETTIKSDTTRMSQLALENESYKKNMAEYSKVNKTLNGEIGRLKVELMNEKESVNQRVNETLANHGLNSGFLVDNITISPPKTKEQIIETFNGLPQSERAEYYKKNKDAISQAMLGS
jgi:predicted RNase H-like nuclease (RuvC/YqgF family)